MDFNIRYAKESDCEAVIALITGLAVYEHMEDQMTNTPELMKQVVFAEKAANVLVCESEGKIVGYSIFFFSYSTFIGKKGIWLEDLYVDPAYRGKGIGKAFFKELCGVALKEDCMRLEWNVLNWNAPSIAFYDSLGSKAMTEWTNRRLTRDGIEHLVKTL